MRVASGRKSLPAIVAAATLMAGAAHAGGDAVAEAERLFNEAKLLVEHRNYTAACPKFAESQRLDPGVGTLLYLADCYQHTNRPASAWTTFRQAAVTARKE